MLSLEKLDKEYTRSLCIVSYKNVNLWLYQNKKLKKIKPESVITGYWKQRGLACLSTSLNRLANLSETQFLCQP